MRTRFREAMIEHLDRAGMTSAELAKRSGVPKTLIDKLRHRKCGGLALRRLFLLTIAFRLLYG